MSSLNGGLSGKNSQMQKTGKKGKQGGLRAFELTHLLLSQSVVALLPLWAHSYTELIVRCSHGSHSSPSSSLHFVRHYTCLHPVSGGQTHDLFRCSLHLNPQEVELLEQHLAVLGVLHSLPARHLRRTCDVKSECRKLYSTAKDLQVSEEVIFKLLRLSHVGCN